MSVSMANELGFVAGATGLLLLAFWDDISTAFGGGESTAGSEDEKFEEEQIAAEEADAGSPDLEHTGPLETALETSFSNKLADALDRGEFKLGNEELTAGTDPATKGSTEDSTGADTLMGAQGDDALAEDEGAPASEAQPANFVLSETLEDDGVVNIRDFDRAADVITVQYDSSASPEEPEVTVAPSEDGESSEISVNGKPRGVVEGVGDLDASEVALVDVGEGTQS